MKTLSTILAGMTASAFISLLLVVALSKSIQLFQIFTILSIFFTLLTILGLVNCVKSPEQIQNDNMELDNKLEDIWSAIRNNEDSNFRDFSNLNKELRQEIDLRMNDFSVEFDRNLSSIWDDINELHTKTNNSLNSKKK